MPGKIHIFKSIICSLLLLLTFVVSGQVSTPSVSGKFENTPATEVFKNLEEQTQYKFFYQQNWIDSISFTASFDSLGLSEALTQLLSETNIGFYIAQKRVILTENVIIIDQPALLSSILEQQQSATIEKGLVFSREYQQQAEADDLENFVFEIGNRTSKKSTQEVTLAGYVTARETGDPIEGALVYIENPFKATSTDEYGFYSITLPPGKHKILIQFVGMKTTQRNVVLFSNGKLNVEMDVDVIALQEITIESDRDKNVNNVQMGVSRISTESAKTVPVVLGENDIMKVATTKAGVQTVGEGASGFNVRGGKTDQNLILINDAPVYNSSHFLGFFSVFNSDVINSMDVFTSGIPAKYGGRLSSIFDIKAKKASTTEFKGMGGISPITSRLTLEVPIKEDKTGLLIGGRSTYSNWVLNRSSNANFKENKVSFYDIIAKLDHKIDDNNQLTISSYYSRDKYRLDSDTLFSFSDFSFVNANGVVKWDRHINSVLDGTLTAIYAQYGYDLLYDQSPANAFTQDFGIKEATIKADMNYYQYDGHKINAGVQLKKYGVNPGTKQPYGDTSAVLSKVIGREQALDNALYISDEYEYSDKIMFYGGLRYSIFNVLGPQEVFYYDPALPLNKDSRIDSATFKSGQIIKTYHGPEWRFSGRYSLDKLSSIKMNISRNRQYIHTLSNSASLSPTDTWRLSGQHLKPQIADQFGIGYFRNLFKSTLEVSVEAYYKRLQNLVDFKTGAEFLLNQQVETEVLQGKGKSYGLEVSVNKTGRLSGWLNYTFARTFIKLDGDFQEERVNRGEYFPTSYDKPHSFNMVSNFKLTRRFSLSWNSTFTTGRPVTIPVAVFDFQGVPNIHFSDRNQYRIPNYFRMDLGVNIEGNHKIQKLSHSFWSISVYNITGRDNPYSVFFDVSETAVKGSQLIVFGNPIPTLSYNFKF